MDLAAVTALKSSVERGERDLGTMHEVAQALAAFEQLLQKQPKRKS